MTTEPVPVCLSEFVFQGREGIGLSEASGLKWKVGQTVTIGFLDDTPLAADIQEVSREWLKYANLKFEFLTAGEAAGADVRITNRQANAFWSRLAMESTRGKPNPSMNLGFTNQNMQRGHFRRLVLHEFGHAIGLHHEHMNPQGAPKIDVPRAVAYLRPLLPNLQDSEIEAQIVDREAATAKYDRTNFDIYSIMRYKYPREVFEPGLDEAVYAAYAVDNFDLSDGDKNMAAFMYPGVYKPAGSTKATLAADGKYVTARFDSATATHRYNFDADAAVYRVTAKGPLPVWFNLFNADGEPAHTFRKNGATVTDPDVEASLFDVLPAGKYHVLVKPAEDAAFGSGEYNIKLAKE